MNSEKMRRCEGSCSDDRRRSKMDSEKMVGAIVTALMFDGAILLLLRATGVITWPWWVALLPILVVVGVIVLLVNAVAVRAVSATITRWVRNRRRADDGH